MKRKSYLSLCFGQKYPEDRMLRDKMLGSMMVSSASGVFLIRPEVTSHEKRNTLNLKKKCGVDFRIFF